MAEHILTAEQFTLKELSRLFLMADSFRASDAKIDTRQEIAKKHAGRQILTVFYEPSTRTRFSFEIAAAKLGINVIGSENAAEFSSAAKGETIEDTIRVFNEYGVDAIVMRSKEEGLAARAAAVSGLVIINAGDGKGEHPTQALLDMYTIYKETGRLDNLKVIIGGDLKRGRTVRSLALLLLKYPSNEITFISSPELKIGEDIKEKLTRRNMKISEDTEFKQSTLKKADVVYWTRLQLERSKSSENNGQKHYSIDEKVLKLLREDAIIMHPLPRQAELPEATDKDPRAKYFRQTGNGLYIRMALLDHIMSGRP